jgi:hypothetical protein
MKVSHDHLMRSIKIVDIGYITVLYIAVAILCAKAVDHVFGNFDEEKEKQKGAARLTLELVGSVWAYGVLAYVVRNVVELIPFPLDGYRGYDHLRVIELRSGMVFSFTFLLFSNMLKNKISFYYKNVL